MNKIPKIINPPQPTFDLSTKTMCHTCAYKTPSSTEEDEMTIMYWNEYPLPHPCHERQNGKVCKGALDTFKRLALKISNDLPKN